MHDDLFSQLAGLDEGVEEEDLSGLNISELLAERERLDIELAHLGEVIAMNPEGPARELHSRRAAVVVLIHAKRRR